MREIKFRGKSGGEWVYGNLLQFFYQDGTGWAEMESQYSSARWRVNQNTVGQFTGLCDSNGKPVYEGDILEVDDYGSYVFGDSKIHQVTWSNKSGDYPAFTLDYGNHDHEVNALQLAKLQYSLKVVDNVHDNPELLQTKND